MAGDDDGLREAGKIAAELFEDDGEFRNEPGEQKNHDRRREHAEQSGIDERCLDLALEILLAGAKFRDLPEHDIEESAGLTGAHHRDVNGRK